MLLRSNYSFFRPMDWVIRQLPEDTTSFNSKAISLRHCSADKVAPVWRRIFAGLLSAGKVDY